MKEELALCMTSIAPIQEKSMVRAMYIIRTLNICYTRHDGIDGFTDILRRYQ